MLAPGSNDRGHFLRVFERGGGFPTGGSSLMIPNGPQNACLRTFCECLSKIAAMLGGEEVRAGRGGGRAAVMCACLRCGQPAAFVPHQPRPRAVQGIEYQPTAPSILTPSAPDVVSLESKETGPVLSVGPKHFFFETRENARGTYVRIKEVRGAAKGRAQASARALLGPPRAAASWPARAAPGSALCVSRRCLAACGMPSSSHWRPSSSSRRPCTLPRCSRPRMAPPATHELEGERA